MKNKLFQLAFWGLIFSACSTSRNVAYLPVPESVSQNQYGSHITITGITGKEWNGELIAVDSAFLIVLDRQSKKCSTIPLTVISSYSLQYAQSSHYGWSIPVLSLFSLSHGYFAIFTFPLNLIMTIVVTQAGESAFVYRNIDLNYDQLKMFARFPQGIPPGINVTEIR